jgi:hypothetical protein
MTEHENDIPLTEAELAKRWTLTTRTLAGWRAKGLGPAFIDIGRNTIRYRMCDVLAYEEKRVKQKHEQQTTKEE